MTDDVELVEQRRLLKISGIGLQMKLRQYQQGQGVFKLPVNAIRTCTFRKFVVKFNIQITIRKFLIKYRSSPANSSMITRVFCKQI